MSAIISNNAFSQARQTVTAGFFRSTLTCSGRRVPHELTITRAFSANSSYATDHSSHREMASCQYTSLDNGRNTNGANSTNPIISSTPLLTPSSIRWYSTSTSKATMATHAISMINHDREWYYGDMNEDMQRAAISRGIQHHSGDCFLSLTEEALEQLLDCQRMYDYGDAYESVARSCVGDREYWFGLLTINVPNQS